MFRMKSSLSLAWEQHPARLAWKTLEPYYAMIYFAPEAREAYTAAGLKGYCRWA